MTNVDEVGELVMTLLATPSHRATACAGWTAHELVAHLTAGAAEEADLIETRLRGAPERATQDLDTREIPFRALPDAQLRDRLVEEAARLAAALERLAADPAHDDVPFTGRRMTSADFTMHSRSECTLHRWDLVGRDDIGWAMLSQPELTAHAVSTLTAMSALAESPMHRIPATVGAGATRLVIRSAPHDDVVIMWGTGSLTMELVPIDDTAPSLELDPAARLLLLWGRREPSAPIDVYADGESRQILTAMVGL